MDKGVATHFFILRHGLKEYGRIVKSAASELLSPVSSFFSLLFSTARISIRCSGFGRIRIQSNASQMYESWRVRFSTRFILYRDLHFCCSGFYGTAVEQGIGSVTKETRRNI